MSNIVEKGYSFSNEFDGAKLKKSIKKTVIKEWVGAATTNINTNINGGDNEYGDITVAGQGYSNAKILNVSYEFRGDQAIKVTEVEQKIDTSGCPGPCGLPKNAIEDYSDSVSVEKGKDSMSFTRSISIKMSNDSSLVSSPSSPSGSSLIDLAISCVKTTLASGSSASSTDPQIQQMIQEASDACGDGKFDSSVNENIDREACAVSVSKTTSKKLGTCDSNCSASSSTSISYDDSGLVSISVSGDVKGEKEDYECDPSGIPIAISKTKMEYAEECFSGIDLDSKLISLYTAHQKESCESDVCLALRRQSKSKTVCRKEGTISYSISAAEEEVNEDSAKGKSKVKDKESKNGCLTTISRNFEFTVPVKDGNVVQQNPIYLSGDCSSVLNAGSSSKNATTALMGKFGSMDTSAPAGFFGPLSMSLSVSEGSLTGSVSFDNDPANDPANSNNNGMIKSSTTTTTTCPQEINTKTQSIPCGEDLEIKTAGAPGSTKICKDVEVFHCGTAADVIGALDIDGGNGTVVEDSFSLSVSDGAKSGSACKKFHTDADLNAC